MSDDDIDGTEGGKPMLNGHSVKQLQNSNDRERLRLIAQQMEVNNRLNELALVAQLLNDSSLKSQDEVRAVLHQRVDVLEQALRQLERTSRSSSEQSGVTGQSGQDKGGAWH